jgi:type I restriction enzyme, S subunit
MSWPKVKLGDCCEIVSGATPKTGNPEYWGGDIPWVSPKSLSKLDTKYLDEPTEYITQAGFDSCSTRMLPPMSLLLSCRAPVGLTAINRESICTNQGFKSLIPNTEVVDVNYLYHVMRKMRPLLEAKGRGATFTEVSKSIVERFEIPLPPLEEQKRIAAILDKADEIKKDSDSSNQLHWNLINAMFSDIFGNLAVNDKNWRLGDISEIAKVSSGYAFKSDWFTNKGTPVIRIGDIQEGLVSVTNAAKIDEDSLEIKERFRLLEGDILMALSGATTGKIGMVSTKERGSYLNQRIANIRPNSTHYGAYLYYLFTNKQIIDKLIKQAGGSAQPNLSPKDLEGFIIPIPENTELSIFNSIANQIQKNKQHTDNRLEDVVLLAQSSLQSLIN